MTVEGRHAFGPVPADRWDHDAFHSTNRRQADQYYAPHGAFIDDVRSFPALHFGIPPRRVEVMDPQQRFSIEVSLQAIEDAGYTPGALPRKTGVFVGVTASEFKKLVGARTSAQLMATGAFGKSPTAEERERLGEWVEQVVPTRPFSAPGALANMCAAAVAQELDLHGPAYTLDAACASALMALSDAVAHLRAGTIDAALAGGVYISLTPDHYLAFSRIGAMSESGYCRPFDHRADGFVQGDGAGAVLLKRVEDAVRDGDRIYAVIHGIATNNDGRGDGPMAPVEDGQVEVIQDAWGDARRDAAGLGYIEAHGTGTAVGDVTEFNGLLRSLHGVKGAWLGSSKANIGHTMSAAGIAGLIRATLSLHHETIPPMAGFERPKDTLEIEDSPLAVPTEPVAWVGDDRLACVSSFGFGGTNGHVVLGTPPAPVAASPTANAELVLMSAATEDALRDLAARTADAIGAHPESSVAGVARAWAIRPKLRWRLAVVAASREELVDRLVAIGSGEVPAGTAFGETPEHMGGVAFLFPGQGAQRLGMLDDARARFPVVEQTLRDLEATLADVLEAPLTELIAPALQRPTDEDAATARLQHTANCQPAMFACSEALRRLLDSVGVRPVIATGHSLGEFNAGVAGGFYTADEGARFVARRGAAMAAITGDPGSMIAIMADAPTAEGLVVEGAVVANYNHPRQHVVSGTTEAVRAVAERADAKRVPNKPLAVSHAFHSALFAELDVGPMVDDMVFTEPSLPVASGIVDHPWSSIEDARAVMRAHAASPVRFTRAVEQCLAAGADVLLQVGAGGPLASFARKTAGGRARAVLTLGSRDDHDGGRSILLGLGWLFVHGQPVDTTAITGHAPTASVPPVVLPREVYWPVQDGQRRSLSARAGITGETASAPTSVTAPASAAAPSAPGNTVLDRVIGIVARVSSYPVAAVRPSSALIEELGFDSLMVNDLSTGLSDAFPGLGGLPQELLINRPTVDGIAQYVERAERGAVDADDDAPLMAYAPTWVPTPLPDSPRFTRGVRVAGPGAEAAAGLARSATGPLVWVASQDAPTPVHAAMAGEVPWRDDAADLLAAVAETGPVDLLVVRRSDDPWAEALAGAARALAREWPERRVKCVAVSPDVDIPWGAALAELVSEDQTVDVRLAGARAVLGLEPSTGAAHSVTADDVVAISGGTRGIGYKLAQQLSAAGARVLLLGRGAPTGDVADWLAATDSATALQVDVTDRQAVLAALGSAGVTGLVHCAGVLADGPVDVVDADAGRRARAVKAAGWLALVAASRPTLRWAVAVGSLAGRFGNRHQAHYAAANALLAALVEATPGGAVCEFGPWSESEMVQTIPAPVQAAMRAEGIDFVGDEAGIGALVQAIGTEGVRVLGRSLPATTRARVHRLVLSTDTHPFLLDHAIEGTPVFPLASAADLMAYVSGLQPPYSVAGLRLFRGIPVTEPVELEVSVRGDRAEIRVGPDRALAYRARVSAGGEPPAQVARHAGGAPSELDVKTFYRQVTFHGPLLAGLVDIEGVSDTTARGTVRTTSPDRWIPDTARSSWSLDPLALDSAMQLAATVAWTRYRRAGTPVSIGRITLLRPLPAHAELTVDVEFGEQSDDRFTASFILSDAEGTIAVVEDAVAELKAVDGDAPLQIKPEWIDISTWAEVRDLDVRLEAATALGIDNPYFSVHQGTAKNTTVVGERELVNYSSYNYIGLSGDPRVLAAVHEAVDRYGTSVSASRVASGERPFHGELEAELADAQGVEDSVVFTAGHATNVTTIGHLLGPGDLVLHDELIHDSALQGIKLSGAGRRGFRHDDPAHLESLLRQLRPHHEKVLIVVEGVYSMDGDICDLPAYIALKKAYGCLLMVDEAHSFGVIGATGCGAGEHFGIDPMDVDIWMGTLSKSLASCGGWIAGSAALIRYLRYTAPGFVYSAGITAANGVAGLASLRLMRQEPERVRELQANALVFHDALKARGVDTGPARGGSAVIPAVTGNSLHALVLSHRLLEQGINVQPIVYPAVADDSARLRFFLSSTHTTEQLVWTADTVADTLEGVRRDFPVPGGR
ncbi:MAG: acyl transferase domain-containing protein/7-keto-8-aminopelargonate synthetase-like enzyme [Myxococcota bacterium]|jgi:acyl transferase domain-containing protein/7-keto-8-aminopelargonate synthetase-like enzyme